MRSLLSIQLLLALLSAGCDGFYTMSGLARIEPAAFHYVGGAAIVCLGRGGPLETSGVYGSVLGAQDGKVEVYCSPPAARRTYVYEEFVIWGGVPRNLHVYAWLERHEEIAERCAHAEENVIFVDYSALAGADSRIPVDRPCNRPIDPTGAVGAAVGFDHPAASTHDYGDIVVRPNGYQDKE